MSSQASKDDLIIPWRHARYYTIQYDGSSSDPFPNKRCEKWCALAPTLSGIFFSWLLSNAVDQSNYKIYLQARTRAKSIDQRDVLRRWRCSHCTYRRSPTATYLLLGHYVTRSGTSAAPNNSTDDHILEVVAGFTYQGSTTASNLSLDAELNKRNSNSSSRKTYLGERHAIVNYKHKDSGILGSCTLYTLVRPSEYWIMYSR